MIHTKTEYRLTQIGAGILLVFVIVLAYSSYLVGANTGQTVMTKALTTVTDTATMTNFETSTFTFYQQVTITNINFSTVTQIGPETVTLSGKAQSNGIGTSAVMLIFVETISNQTYTTPITNGVYAYEIVNHAYYNVWIDYTTAVGGIGSGECSAGGMVLFATVDTVQADWSC